MSTLTEDGNGTAQLEELLREGNQLKKQQLEMQAKASEERERGRIIKYFLKEGSPETKAKLKVDMKAKNAL